MNIFYIGMEIFLLGGFFGLFCKQKSKILVISIFYAIATAFCLVPTMRVLTSGNTLEKSFNLMPIFNSVNFVIDPLSAFFITIIVIMCLVATIYANGYLKPYIEKDKNINSHLIFLTTLIVSMLAVVTCQNALMFLICWEIMSLSSFFLVIFEGEKPDSSPFIIGYLTHTQQHQVM